MTDKPPTPKPGCEARQAVPYGTGIGADGEPNIVDEADLDRQLAAAARARITGKLEDWHAAGFPLRIRKNDV
jgi:hypothetical protein